ncbi:MAG: peptide MFS transporter [Ignavibacteriales bacterium]|nr:peptide MFS transporter [Ignavibacteriales bacterium]
MFKNHPRGLTILFFTEMWERFGFYLMLGIFTLYMIDPTSNGGMGFSFAQSADIYGTYIALVYLTPFLGGLLADRVLGYRKAITIGGLLMAAGYIGLSFHGEMIFYISLLLVILGNGFFKPNISTLVGKLYDNNPNYKPYKDSGFNIFYMGINIGAFVCNFIAAFLRNQYGWGYAFAAAGIGMLLGLIWFWSGQKHVKEADVMSPKRKEDMHIGKLSAVIFLPAGIAGLIGWFLPEMLFGGPLLGNNSTDAFLFAAIPIVFFYGSVWFKSSKEEKQPIGALLAVFGVVIIFWAIFHQNGSALTLWAERYTDREVSGVVGDVSSTLYLHQEVYTSHVLVPQEKSFQSKPIKLNEVEENGFSAVVDSNTISQQDIKYIPIVERDTSIKTSSNGSLGEINTSEVLIGSTNDSYKINFFDEKENLLGNIYIYDENFDGDISWKNELNDELQNMVAIYESVNPYFIVIKFQGENFDERLFISINKMNGTDNGRIRYDLPALYYSNISPDKWPPEDKSLKLLSTEIFQSINPFWVVVLTPLIVAFWGMLRRKKKEPSTPTKIFFGMLITAASTIVMMLAVTASENGLIKSPAFWLVGTYAIITIGELCLSPMGLSLVSKLSPKRVAGLMMGGWFLSTSIGNKLSGVISGLWEQIDNKVFFFVINLAGALLGAILILILLKWLNRVIKEYSESK